jgi:hypothetical protein
MEVAFNSVDFYDNISLLCIIICISNFKLMKEIQGILLILAGLFSLWFLYGKFIKKDKDSDSNCGKDCGC